MKYKVVATLRVSKTLGVFEADSPEQAGELANQKVRAAATPTDFERGPLVGDITDRCFEITPVQRTASTRTHLQRPDSSATGEGHVAAAPRTKRANLTDADSCLREAAMSEPIFVLRGQDALAIDTVQDWIDKARDVCTSDSKIREAEAWIVRTIAWQNVYGTKHPS